MKVILLLLLINVFALAELKFPQKPKTQVQAGNHFNAQIEKTGKNLKIFLKDKNKNLDLEKTEVEVYAFTKAGEKQNLRFVRRLDHFAIVDELSKSNLQIEVRANFEGQQDTFRFNLTHSLP